jgi:hypothetical protein
MARPALYHPHLNFVDSSSKRGVTSTSFLDEPGSVRIGFVLLNFGI